VVGIIVSKHMYPGYAEAFVVHEVNFPHHEVSAHPEPLTDAEVIRLACQRLNSPINFGETVSEWRSVQEYVAIGEGICVFYNALFLKGQGNRYLITLADLCRGDYEAFDSAEKITPADCREDDEGDDCVTVSVPQCGFRAEYCRALRQVYKFDPRWQTANGALAGKPPPRSPPPSVPAPCFGARGLLCAGEGCPALALGIQACCPCYAAGMPLSASGLVWMRTGASDTGRAGTGCGGSRRGQPAVRLAGRGCP
jgi:hypothetical protein